MNRDTKLLRQVHPLYAKEGRIGTLAFTLNSGDEGKMSVYDGDMITAEASLHHYTEDSKQSAGVAMVAVGEVEDLEFPEKTDGTNAAKKGKVTGAKPAKLTVVPDPKEFPEHVLIDMNSISGNQQRKAAKKLAAFARDHGWQYQQS